MARTLNGVDHAPNETLISLTRLLSILERKSIQNEEQPLTRPSVYDQMKSRANLEYANTLLFQLEHDVGSVQSPAQKQKLLADLRGKRKLIKSINHRLLKEALAEEANDIAEESDSETNAAHHASRAPEHSSSPQTSDDNTNTRAPPGDSSNKDSSEVRLRNPSKKSAGTASDGVLFSTGAATRSSQPSQSARESEQENLKWSLVEMAKTLKEQSLKFGTSLEADRDMLDSAATGLDRSNVAMQNTSKGMGTLRRLTEGRGLWGRVLLYAWIAGLWVAALVIVFVLPKLRF